MYQAKHPTITIITTIITTIVQGMREIPIPQILNLVALLPMETKTLEPKDQIQLKAIDNLLTLMK
jgi:hypothetical protein